MGKQHKEIKSLRRQQGHSRALLQSVPDLLIECAFDGLILDALGTDNSAALVAGAVVEAGRGLDDLWPAPVAQELHQVIARVHEKGLMETLEYPNTDLQHPQTFEARVTPCTDASVLVVIREISDQIAARRALRASEEKFRGLIANLPGAIYRCLNDSSFTMEFISDGIEAISGYPASDFLGNTVRSYKSLIHEDDLHWLEAAINHARFTHQPYELEYRILHGSGELRWVYERGRFVYDDKRKPKGLDGAIFDVTDRKRSEEELRVAEENYRIMFQKNLEEGLKLEYIQKDLNAASSIQANILPHRSPLFPNHPRADVAATIIPAKDVGGDFFDAFALDADTICMVVADVSGKGIPAALFMVRAITSLRLSISLNEPLADSVQAINRHLCEGNDSFMFVTVFIALLNVSTGELRYVNAGHNPPLVASEQGAYTLLPSPRGSLALGLDEQVSFSVLERRLEPGDRLLLYTDGVTEGEDAAGGFFSLERTVQVLDGLPPSESAEGIVDALKQAVFRFAAEAPQSDDVTILALRYGARM